MSLLHERECVDAHRGAGFATRRSDRFLPLNGDKRRELKIEEFHTEHRKAIAFLYMIYLCGLQLQRFCGSLERESQFLSLRCIPHCPGCACGKRFEASLQQHTCCSHCSLESLVCVQRIYSTHTRNTTLFCQLRVTLTLRGSYVASTKRSNLINRDCIQGRENDGLICSLSTVVSLLTPSIKIGNTRREILFFCKIDNCF